MSKNRWSFQNNNDDDDDDDDDDYKIKPPPTTHSMIIPLETKAVAISLIFHSSQPCDVHVLERKNKKNLKVALSSRDEIVLFPILRGDEILA